MRFRLRIELLALAGVVLVLALPAGADAFGIESFVAVNCKSGGANEKCASTEATVLPPPFAPYSFPKEPNEAESKAQGFTQAGGHIPFGVTDFKIKTTGSFPNQAPEGALEGGIVTHIRTDVAPGLATSPAVVPQCSIAELGIEALPELYLAPTCSESSVVGLNKATIWAGKEFTPGVSDLPLEGKVYNLVQKTGLASEFGVALKLPKPITEGELFEIFKGSKPEIEKEQYYAHTLIEGNVEWGKEAKGTNEGDYHDYFEINVSNKSPLISSRLVFFGTTGNGAFLTNATSCPGKTTTTLRLTDEAGKTVSAPYKNPFVSLENCGAVPFEPSLAFAPATTAQDTPNGLSATLSLPRYPLGKGGKGAENEPDTAEVKNAEFTLPEGMTLNPAAAAGLTACTPAQARIHSSEKGVACPSSSEIGTVALEVPQLPAGSLTGKIYLGGPESGPITGSPYKMYVDAESERYGVSVRLEGTVIPNEATGRVTTIFSENPEQPFTSIALKFKQGALAPIANPLVCGVNNLTSSLSPYTGTPAAASLSNPFTVDSNGAGGACASPAAFAPKQSTTDQTTQAGAHTSFTFSLERGDGNQYFSGVSTTLPEGLVGAIPAATQCAEGPANSETEECPSSSRIGTATITAGAGPTPFTFTGPVYLTGPYQGAPFGLSIKVAAVAGPFNLGTVVARAKITIDEHTARVTTSDASVPRIRRGIPDRLKRITIAIEKQGFMSNPTNCSALATESSVSGFTLTGEPGTTGSATLSTPFQATNCTALKFKPSFKAATGSNHTRAGGASLETTLNLPSGGANVKSVLVTLPGSLPSRQATFSKACLLATFNANPLNCGPPIGGVRANTPLLKDKMTGPVYFVAVGGAQFPDIDLVLNADGVRVIVVGETKITKGITTTHFATPPDVPVSSITVNLPMGPRSALSGFGNFCPHPLFMPTTIEGQNGKVVKQNTKIHVTGCPVQIVGHKVVGRTLFLTIKTPGAGRISAKGSGLRTVFRRLRGASEAATLKVPLTGSGRSRVRVGFVPSSRSLKTSVAFLSLNL